MSKRIILFTFLLFSAAISFAQTKTVKGKITDDAGAPSVGVSVLHTATKKGTQTNAFGEFAIEVPANAKSLVFSSVGYKTRTENISGKDNISVIMERTATTGDEVVVIGYQTVRRKDLTGSVSSVGAKQIKDIPVNSAAEALTGRLAGVQLSSTEGKPGADFTIRVRGGGSITQDNTPLYIVDGSQVENALSVLSPQDIESVDVLKDASATAIYGARGANGVMIITTKKGRNGKTVISYNGFTGIRQLSNKLDVLKPYDFVKYQYERWKLPQGSNTTDSSTFAKNYGSTFDTLNVYKNYPYIDWQEELFGRDAMFQSHNITVSGGAGNTQFTFGATSNKEEGILLNNGFDRKLFNFSLDHQANSRLKLGVTTRYNQTNIQGVGTSSGDGQGASTSRLRQAVRYRPLAIKGQGLEDYDADYALETNSNSLSLVNPILYNESEYRRNKTDVLNLSTYVQLKLTKWLSFKTTFGYDLTNGRQKAFDDSLSNNSKQNGASQPLASIGTTKRITYNNSNVLTYSNTGSKKKFAKRNTITALIGHEIYELTNQNQTAEARFFPLKIDPEVALGNLSLGSPPPSSFVKPTSFTATSRIVSGFARFNYSRDNKYLLTLSSRADGSSKFSADHKWSYFPSGSVAWKISEEKFFSKIKNIASEVKLRVSYGTAGNNRINDYLYTTAYNANGAYGLNDALISGYLPNALSNPDLVWEKTNSKNLGLDLSFLRGRINLTTDIYKNDTKDLLVDQPIPTSSGYTKQVRNAGATQNKGVELQLTATPVSTKNFQWTSSFNISWNNNVIKRLGDRQTQQLASSAWLNNNTPPDYILRVGDPVGSMYGYTTDGFYQISDFDYDAANAIPYKLKAGVASNGGVTSEAPYPGTLKFKDLNGDGVVNDADRSIIGNANPKYFGGFNNQFAYKNFDFSAFVNFQVGNDIYNANKLEFTSGFTPNANLLEIVNERWTNIDASGNVVKDPAQLAALNVNAKLWTPSKAANSFILHSWAVEKASFLRINNLSLGYTLPTAWTSRAKISKFRIYATASNLKVFTDYSGYDPEVSTRKGIGSGNVTPGVDYSAYPRSRSYIFGINLTL